MSRLRHRDRWLRVAAPAVVASLVLWAPSCRVGPDAAPEVDAPGTEAVPAPAREGVSADQPVAPRWWELVDDPTLHALIARAEERNTSLEAALGAVRAAYAGVGMSESQLWPTVGFGAQYARTLTNIAQLAADGVRSEPYDMYAYGIGMPSWEIDLWGSVKRQVEVAKADAAKQVELMRDALVSVRAQVGAVYGQLRTLEERRAVLARSVEVYASIRDTVKARYDAGVVTGLDLARVEAQLDAARAQLPQVDAGIAGALAQLAVLCGAEPAEIAGLVAARDAEAVARAIPAVPDVVGVGLPADLLERRPDVRAAREELRAATERIGIAQAAKLPSISISGNFYIAANTFSGLGDLANKAYTIGPAIWWPIFEGGRLDAQAAQQKALAEAALARYRGAVLEAIADLSASTGDFVEAREGVRLAGTARASARRARELAEKQFDAGVTDITVLLDVRRQELDAERAEVEARGIVLQSFVSLCRSLGGGWSDEDLDRAAAKDAEPVISLESRE
jgi:NodT family efflux transporter outer membrane factor (OMF) lipoprotein